MNEVNEEIKEEKLHRKLVKEYKKKREHILAGYVNCIPLPFKRFKSEFPGVEMGKYYLVSGNEKSAKSQITDFIFLISPLIYAYNNRDKIKLKILYFSLEMSIIEKFNQLTCFWLYWHSKGLIRIDTKQLTSLNEESPLSEDILKILESKEYQDFFDFIEDTVIFDESNSNPFGIYKTCKEFAEARGKYKYKTIKWKNNDTGLLEDKRVIASFEKDDPEEYWIVITDHLSLLQNEKGMDLRETIGKHSKNCVSLRNYFNFTIVNIQQQSAESQSNESFKLDRLYPHPGNLADNKSTKNDLNIMLGIFSPFRFKKPIWEGYNINQFKDNIRFLEICLNRSGSSGSICPLYFDGAVNFFSELPLPNDTNNLKIYQEMALKAQQSQIKK